MAKLTNTNPTVSQSVSESVVQTNEGRILGRGHSNQSWPAGAEAEAEEADADDAAAHFQLVLEPFLEGPPEAEAEADEADADDAAAHFQLVAKLTNTNPTVSQSVSQSVSCSNKRGLHPR